MPRRYLMGWSGVISLFQIIKEFDFYSYSSSPPASTFRNQLHFHMRRAFSCNSMDCAAYSKAGIKGIHTFIPTINWLRPTKDTCIQFSRRSPRSLSLLNCFAKILRNGLNLQSSEIIPAPDFI